MSDWSSDVCSSDLRPINDRQRPQPEEVELHQAYRLDVVLVELRDRVAAVPLPVMLGEQRAEVGQWRRRDHHAAGVLAGVAGEVLELQDRKSTRLNSSH